MTIEVTLFVGVLRGWLFLMLCMPAFVVGAISVRPAAFSQLDDPWLGKPIFVVDRLDDYAEGEKTIAHTLRWATEQLREGGGIVVFRTSGTIKLVRKIRIPNESHNWLIAGYTAPAPGVLVAHHGWDVAGQNWSIEHIRIRPGSFAYNDRNGDQNDALGITGERKVTLSPDAAYRDKNAIKNGRVVNCSLSWASDELVQIWFPPIVNVDFVNCIFTEPLHDPSLHPKPEVHGFGPLVAADVGPIGFNQCLFANSLRRNPRVNDGAPVFIGNSALLNPGGAGVELRTARDFRPDGTPKTPRLPGGELPRAHILTVTNTLYIAGPNTQPATNLLAQGEVLTANSKLYVRDNFRWDAAGKTWRDLRDGAALEAEKTEPFAVWQETMPVAPTGFFGLPPDAVEKKIAESAGAFPRHRDATDLRAIEQLANRTGGKIMRQSDAGIDRKGRPHDADGYEILPVTRWADGDDVATAWALPADAGDKVAVKTWLDAKRVRLEP